MDPEEERKQIEHLQKLRQDRDNALVKEKLDRLEEVAVKKTADNKVNIVPATLEAVKAYATVGEIFAVLRQVFGEFKPSTAL